MSMNRRDLIVGSVPLVAGATAIAPVARAKASSQNQSSLDLSEVGLAVGSQADQTKVLQKAINLAAKKGLKLSLPGGVFYTSALSLPSKLHIEGVKNATVLKFLGGAGFLFAKDATGIFLENLILDGASKPFSDQQSEALLEFERVKDFGVQNCLIKDSLISGVSLKESAGFISSSEISLCAVTGIFALDSNGLSITDSYIHDCDNNGVLIWRSTKSYDGSQVTNNRIERIRAKAGGTGQNGNGVNVYRAGSVLVSHNVIDDCTFSAIRNNGGDNVQILNNSCSNLGEVALYSEFKFQGAVINNNLVDGAHIGISITNFNEGGRLATATGNLIRNMKKRDGVPALGIGVEADTLVTGNVVEQVEGVGIGIGWDKYMRHVTANNNLIRKTDIGVGVTGDGEAGYALIATNMIEASKNGGIRAMDKHKAYGPDLAKTSAESFRHLAIYGNVSL